MQVGVFIALFQDRSFAEALDEVVSAGVTAVEISTGGYVGNAHVKPHLLLQDEAARTELVAQLEQRNITIDALSCHGNALHPQQQIITRRFRTPFCWPKSSASIR
jgi:sugar phosphate isomerase/epimerase